MYLLLIYICLCRMDEQWWIVRYSARRDLQLLLHSRLLVTEGVQLTKPGWTGAECSTSIKLLSCFHFAQLVTNSLKWKPNRKQTRPTPTPPSSIQPNPIPTLMKTVILIQLTYIHTYIHTYIWTQSIFHPHSSSLTTVVTLQ
jgi:hypothetical protein